MFRLATEEDLDSIDLMYQECIKDLEGRGLCQWEYAKYPNRNTFINALKEQSFFILLEEAEIIGAVILNERQSEEWAEVEWQLNDQRILIIHALAIHPWAQGRGYGKAILAECEAHALKNDYQVIRLDVFSENEAAIKLYEKQRYLKVGAILFDFKPIEHQQYLCYEKDLLK